MYFPHPFHPDESTRAGRMMMAGRVKVTMTSPTTGDHITILFKCIADNRNRQYKGNVDKNWIECSYPDATHVFAEVPNASGEWNDKVGTYYPRTGKWFDADRADKSRVWAAQAVAHWLEHPGTPPAGARYQEASECGVCGKELTDPASIERGIGPVCLGRLTGSHHQEKVKIGIAGNNAKTGEVVSIVPDLPPEADVIIATPGHVLFNGKCQGVQILLTHLDGTVETMGVETNYSIAYEKDPEENIQKHLDETHKGIDGDNSFMGR